MLMLFATRSASRSDSSSSLKSNVKPVSKSDLSLVLVGVSFVTAPLTSFLYSSSIFSEYPKHLFNISGIPILLFCYISDIPALHISLAFNKPKYST